MISTVALLAYAAVLAVLGGRLLRRVGRLERAPRLGLVLWQAATVSVLGAVVLAGLTLVVPAGRPSHGLADILNACQTLLQSHYGGVKQPVGAYAGLLIAAGVSAWTAACVIVTFAVTARRRSEHVRVLAVVARRRPDLDALVLEHDQPVVYCMPGRRRCVVLSTGALERLTEAQLAAVLAHERAHLGARHDIAVNIAGAIAWAFPGVPLFRAARHEIAHLVELRADDVAAQRHDRATIAAALVTVGAGRIPATALAAGGPAAIVRVRRLLGPHRRLSRPARAAGALGAGLLIAVPVVLAANPAVLAILERHCHLPL
ncbi:M56 family metallopeptidase [Actinomadura vinacea]|uniref:M56 family metallopeptidase n=1 Tax=Actinomadura vinacea TaxID=115336 RepID=A0ABN3K397_9ACTN